QPLEPLEIEHAALDLIGARLGDDVDDAAGGAAVFGWGAGRHDLELLYRFERDVDGRALPAHLLAEEAVVVVAAIEADVVEHAALAGKVDLVAVGSLADADAGGQGEQVLELAPEDRRRLDRLLVERGGGRGARRFDGGRLRRDSDRFGHAGYLHARRQADRFTD